MPNRILKESIITSETLARLSDAEERHFIRLLVQADDFGCFDARPQVVRARTYAMMLSMVDEAESERRTRVLQETGFIHLYEVDGKRYGHFPTWDKHQQRRAVHRKYPEPSCDSMCNQVKSDDIITLGTGNQVISPDSICHRIRGVEESRNEESRSRGELAGASSETQPQAAPPISSEVPLKVVEIPKEFEPLTTLKGFVKRDYVKTWEEIRLACESESVKVEDVIRHYVKDYAYLSGKYFWSDPVAALRRNIKRQIGEYKKSNNGVGGMNLPPRRAHEEIASKGRAWNVVRGSAQEKL